MDEQTLRAAESYHDLLRDDRALAQELEERFFERLSAARLSFGGRPLCQFARPNFVSADAYEHVRQVCRLIFTAVSKLEAHLGPALFDLVGVRPEERELASIDPGFRPSSPLWRLDSFLTESAYNFVELNAETPAGVAYNEVLTDVFLELPVMKRFQESHTLTRFHSMQRLLETLVRCYREMGGEAEFPTIAVVDYEEVPTRTEHHLSAEFFEARGYPSLVCDPRHLSYEGGRLRHDGREIDIIYKRLLVNEFLERIDQLDALVAAIREQAVTLVNPLRCKPIHKKAVFAVLTDEKQQSVLSEAERAAVRVHVPWTRVVAEGRTRYQDREVDLLALVREHRARLVIKPNDEYGGKGVFIGWELDESEWDSAIETALRGSYVVQEKVELRRQEFPVIGDAGISYQKLVVDFDPYVYLGEVEGFLTRLSASSLANVSSGGGQVPSFLIEPR